MVCLQMCKNEIHPGPTSGKANVFHMLHVFYVLMDRVNNVEKQILQN